MSLAVAFTLLSGADLRAQQPVTLQIVLGRLSHYLADYAERLPATIATEHYEQRSGAGRSSSDRVVLVSEFGIMRMDGRLDDGTGGVAWAS